MKLLQRQLRRLGLSPDTPPTPEQWKLLLETVGRTYNDAEQDRYLLERSLTISSREMRDLHEGLRERSASELARERDKLAKLVASYDAVLEAAIDGVLVTDGKGRVVRFSKRFAELFGITHLAHEDTAERLHSVAQKFADPDKMIARTREIVEGPPTSSCDEIALADGRARACPAPARRGSPRRGGRRRRRPCP